jgi:hypothetical protein
MLKINILREAVARGRRWSVGNWDDYLTYLEDNNLPKPPGEVVISVVIDADVPTDDCRPYLDSFENQVPFMFALKPEVVEYSIIGLY